MNEKNNPLLDVKVLLFIFILTHFSMIFYSLSIGALLNAGFIMVGKEFSGFNESISFMISLWFYFSAFRMREAAIYSITRQARISVERGVITFAKAVMLVPVYLFLVGNSRK